VSDSITAEQREALGREQGKQNLLRKIAASSDIQTANATLQSPSLLLHLVNSKISGSSQNCSGSSQNSLTSYFIAFKHISLSIYSAGINRKIDKSFDNTYFHISCVIYSSGMSFLRVFFNLFLPTFPALYFLLEYTFFRINYIIDKIKNVYFIECIHSNLQLFQFLPSSLSLLLIS